VNLKNVASLEEALSRPCEEDVAAMAEMGGDLLILGAGGKMGPSLAARAKRAAEQAGVQVRVIAVSRWSRDEPRNLLRQQGIETISAELLEERELASLPDVPNVVFMAARKFGSTGAEAYTWAMNVYLPARVAERYRNSRIVAFSSGNVYPLVPVTSGGATEETPLSGVGEYAQSVLGRERMLQHLSAQHGTKVALLRLNYAVEMRYGVLLDIGRKVFAREAVDLGTGNVNVIWQGDANSICLRLFRHCATPPIALNVTGPETLSVRWIAECFGRHFGVEPAFSGQEAQTALLSNAARCHRLFGYPRVTVEELIEATAHWIGMNGPTYDKPTHFDARDGKF